jgi:hypothetical protein
MKTYHCVRCDVREAVTEPDPPKMLLRDGNWYFPVWHSGQDRLPVADAWEHQSGWLRGIPRAFGRRVCVCADCATPYLNEVYFD